MSYISEHQAEVGYTSADPSDYVQLLKPRVMSLVVFTALAGLFCRLCLAAGDCCWCWRLRRAQHVV